MEWIFSLLIDPVYICFIWIGIMKMYDLVYVSVKQFLANLFLFQFDVLKLHMCRHTHFVTLCHEKESEKE